MPKANSLEEPGAAPEAAEGPLRPAMSLSASTSSPKKRHHRYMLELLPIRLVPVASSDWLLRYCLSNIVCRLSWHALVAGKDSQPL